MQGIDPRSKVELVRRRKLLRSLWDDVEATSEIHDSCGAVLDMSRRITESPSARGPLSLV
jgi:hypothetical protein